MTRCLAKDAHQRFDSTASLRDSLQAIPQRPYEQAETAEPFIVVVPFRNSSPDPDNDYFIDGLAEEIIADLSRLEGVKVISSRSAMRLKGTDKNAATLGQELGVGYLLDGAVRKAGDAIRITAQLTSTADDTVLWTHKFGGQLDDVFAIQEDISRKIVEGLEVQLAPNELAQLKQRPIDDVRAYDAYQKARHEIWTGTEESLERALGLISSAREIVGESVLLSHAEGMAYVQYLHYGLRSDESYLHRAQQCVNRILAVDPESANGHSLQCFIRYKQGQLRSAGASARRALAAEADHPKR